jgi:hypothetical protein
VSDNVLRLIPTNPQYVPETASAELARKQLAELVPDADEVTQTTSGDLQFVDPGANLERISCPMCGQDLPMEWWREQMDEAFKARFATLAVTAPCCRANVSLNDLNYEWPAGFARFVLEAMNPGVADLAAAEIATIAEIVGSPLRLIWAHY